MKIQTTDNAEWAVESIGIDRLGIFKNGICQGIVRDLEEAYKWLRVRGYTSRFPGSSDNVDSLTRALRKL